MARSTRTLDPDDGGSAGERTLPALTIAWSGGLARAGEQLLLPARHRVVLGRDRVVFPHGPLGDDGMSREHARLGSDGATCWVTDLGSKNGTFVNGERVDERALRPGDVVRVGATLLVAHEMPASAPEVHLPELVGVGRSAVELRAEVIRLGPSDLSALVLGETGTGKEVVSRAIHAASGRSGPFVPVNCASLSDDLAGSELFGHERGAFTGADSRRDGLFHAADGGTLVLDEVGELAPALQATLLRALQEKAVRRVGSTRETPVDVRVVAATNLDVEQAAAEGRFRADLLARLSAWTLRTTPLRDRREDLGVLVRALLPAPATDVERPLMEALLRHPWAQNVRGLLNVLTLASAEQGAPRLRLTPTVERALGDGAPGQAAAAEDDVDSLADALRRAQGNVAAAARLLGLSRPTFYRRMQAAGLTAEAFRPD